MALATSSPNARPAPFLSSQSPLCKPAPPFGHTTGNSNSVGFASLGSQPSSALGFGFASSAPMPSASFGGPVSGPSLPTLTTHQRQQPRKPSSNRRRRREDSSDEEAELEDLRPIRPVKKMRAPSTSVREPTAASMPQNAAPADEILRQLGQLPVFSHSNWINTHCHCQQVTCPSQISSQCSIN